MMAPREERHARRNTTALVAVARVMERVDEALLPAVYLYVSCALRASPAALGSITAARSLSQALTSPIGGVLGESLRCLLCMSGAPPFLPGY